MENKPKIMIVDDAEMNRQLLMSILGEEYTYIEAEDGNQALHLLQKDLSIDLMLLGIWRGNPRPFNDRDESAACFFKA
jgi:PleD family two-component response regulator